MGIKRDGASWLFLHDGLPDHPKIEGLSDRAFRALVELWCYCSRHLTDGYVNETAWLKRTTPKVRQELIKAGLVDLALAVTDDGSASESRLHSTIKDVVMHDYLDWQRSAQDAATHTSKKAAAGSLGNHRRWHVSAGKSVDDCSFCAEEGPTRGLQTSSQAGSQEGSQVRSQTDRRPIAEKRREESGSLGRERPDGNGRERRPAPPRCADHAARSAGSWIPPCGACAELREAALLADQTAAAQAERDRIDAAQRAATCAASGRCDGRWLLEYRDGPPVRPAVKCDHRLRPIAGAS